MWLVLQSCDRFNLVLGDSVKCWMVFAIFILLW